MISRTHIAINSGKNETAHSFHRSIKGVSNTSINLHPKGIGKGYEKYRAFSKETIGSINARMGYISNFRKSGEEAIFIHGTKCGKVALYSHNVSDRKLYSVKEFLSHIKTVHNIDLRKANNSRLHVLSCFGVSNGVYQAFSDELAREVTGYGDGNAILTSLDLCNHFKKETSIIKSVVGDVEKERREDLKFTKASLHEFIPRNPKTE